MGRHETMEEGKQKGGREEREKEWNEQEGGKGGRDRAVRYKSNAHA